MGASRLRVWLRRGFAVLVLGVVAAAAWFVFVRDDSGEAENRDPRAAGVSRQADKVVRGLDAEEQVDQVVGGLAAGR